MTLNIIKVNLVFVGYYEPIASEAHQLTDIPIHASHFLVFLVENTVLAAIILDIGDGSYFFRFILHCRATQK
jgi:hypothetical protein